MKQANIETSVQLLSTIGKARNILLDFYRTELPEDAEKSLNEIEKAINGLFMDSAVLLTEIAVDQQPHP